MIAKTRPLAKASRPNAPADGGRLGHPSGLTDMLLYRLNRLRAVGGGMVLRYCEGQFGITRREWVILALLSDGIPATMSGLASKAELPMSATSKAVGSLTEKKLVSRESVRGDRRFTHISLTARGLDVYGGMLPLVANVNNELMAGLSATEVSALDGLLERLEAQATLMAARLASLPKADRRRGSAHRRVSVADTRNQTTVLTEGVVDE